MTSLSDYLIWRYKYPTQKLVESNPPNWNNRNKEIVYQISCPPNCVHQGELVCSRWNSIPLPDSFSVSKTQLKLREGYFNYEPSPNNNSHIEWYLNFAAGNLFCAYGSGLFAQDEMQVAEHPALGSLREYFEDQNIAPLTKEKGQPTPILILGAERRCAIAIEPNPEEGRPLGLYGRNFAKASPEAIKKATKALNPPTINNLIAMEAPAYGLGKYSRKQIEFILTTAWTGYLAARHESVLQHPKKLQVIIHTGFWGCGAYGGNRVLMALLQIIAAYLSEINVLVFHVGDEQGIQDFKKAEKIFKEDLMINDTEENLLSMIEKIKRMEFRWG